MTALIAVAGPVLYVVLGLMVARKFWTRMGGMPKGKTDLEDMANVWVLCLAFICWPLTLLIAGMVWFITGGLRKKQPRS